jgi:cytochrome c oxidase assembly protein subunit 11
MIIKNKKYFKIFSAVVLFVIIILSINIFINKLKKDDVNSKEPIIINLLTSVHPNLPWSFQPIEQQIIVRPGEIKTIEYIVKNLKEAPSTGIATFAYFPNQFGKYIRKLNCFCYDARTLNSKQQDNYSVVILIDPEVTKDSKTKNIKEVTIQFTFFDYKEYKENES